MTDLTPIPALGPDQSQTVSIGGFTLRENTGLALASLACGEDLEPFGVRLPPAGAITQTAAGYTGIWIGQGQWMMAAQDMAQNDFAALVLTELGPHPAKVTEQTDGWVAFEITAPDAACLQAVLEHLVNLPARATAPGCGVRTLVHHMSVLVLRRSSKELTVLGLRSYAQSLHDVLDLALRNRLP